MRKRSLKKKWRKLRQTTWRLRKQRAEERSLDKSVGTCTNICYRMPGAYDEQHLWKLLMMI